MSTFIDKSDYGTLIKNNILDSITDADDTKLDKAETMAIEEMAGYLSARYDVDAIFAATGSNRNPLIVMRVIDIALYNVHSEISPYKIPQLRIDRYKNALQWLKDIQQCIVNPPSLPLITTGEKDYIMYGGNAPRESHI